MIDVPLFNGPATRATRSLFTRRNDLPFSKSVLLSANFRPLRERPLCPRPYEPDAAPAVFSTCVWRPDKKTRCPPTVCSDCYMTRSTQDMVCYAKALSRRLLSGYAGRRAYEPVPVTHAFRRFDPPEARKGRRPETANHKSVLAVECALITRFHHMTRSRRTRCPCPHQNSSYSSARICRQAPTNEVALYGRLRRVCRSWLLVTATIRVQTCLCCSARLFLN